MQARSLRFAATARALSQAARSAGFMAPGFRSPPRVQGRVRTIRRHANGSSTVALVVRDRPWSAVLADMIEGVVAANEETGQSSEELRDLLWAVVEDIDLTETPPARASQLQVVDSAA